MISPVAREAEKCSLAVAQREKETGMVNKPSLCHICLLKNVSMFCLLFSCVYVPSSTVDWVYQSGSSRETTHEMWVCVCVWESESVCVCVCVSECVCVCRERERKKERLIEFKDLAQVIVKSVASKVVHLPMQETWDIGLIPRSGRTPGKGSGNPLQYSCLENSMDRKNLAGYSLWGHRAGHDWARTHTQSLLKAGKSENRAGWQARVCRSLKAVCRHNAFFLGDSWNVKAFNWLDEAHHTMQVPCLPQSLLISTWISSEK